MTPSAARFPRLTLVLLAAALAVAGRSEAKVLLTQQQALDLAFGHRAASEPGRVERTTVFLTDDQLARARGLAGPGVDIPSALVTRYVGTEKGAPIGTAYFDTHIVRTLPETLMIVVAPDGSVARVDVAVFAEPEEYLPKPAWLEQFVTRLLDADLSTKRGIHGITGATLSSGAVTDAVRRILAIHRVIAETEREGR